MTDSLGDILKNRGHSEPPEIQKIKQFVEAEIDQTPRVALINGNFFVSISGASAANNLRLKIYPLQREIGMDKKIIIKIV